MAYPFKTYQINIPAEKTEIYTVSRQELIFSATICNQNAEASTVSLWTRIGGVESPVEYQISVPGTNSADNRAIAVALEKITMESGDAILASGGNVIVSVSGYGSAVTTDYGTTATTDWGNAASGAETSGAGASEGGSSNLTLTISILY